MDSRKSIGGESLRESLYTCTFIINVSHNFYKNLFGFSQNLLGENLWENGFSDSGRISSPELNMLILLFVMQQVERGDFVGFFFSRNT